MDARSERREARRQAHRKEYEITPESEAAFYRGYEEVFGPLDNSTPVTPHVIQNFYGTVINYHCGHHEADEHIPRTAPPQKFTIVNVKIIRDDSSVISSIKMVLGEFGIQIGDNDVTIVGTEHGMPRKDSKRYTRDFELTDEHSASVLAVLGSRPIIVRTTKGKVLEIAKKLSYRQVLEKELLLMGQELLTHRFGPSDVTIIGETVVYADERFPTKKIHVSVKDLLADEEFLEKTRTVLNFSARTELRDMMQSL